MHDMKKLIFHCNKIVLLGMKFTVSNHSYKNKPNELSFLFM